MHFNILRERTMCKRSLSRYNRVPERPLPKRAARFTRTLLTFLRENSNARVLIQLRMVGPSIDRYGQKRND